jgi:hypothetical protein
MPQVDDCIFFARRLSDHVLRQKTISEGSIAGSIDCRGEGLNPQGGLGPNTMVCFRSMRIMQIGRAVL